MQKQHFVNWKDGMKIGVPHLLALENSLLQQSHQLAVCHVHAFNYGIIAQTEGDLLQIDGEENRLYLKGGFQAITSEGSYIDIRPTLYGIHQQLPEMQGVFNVFLQLNPFKRGITIGTANTNEHPLRQPFILPNYSLQIEAGTARLEKKPHRLLIGCIQRIRGEWTLDKRFIPACRSMKAQPQIQAKYQHFVAQMKEVHTSWRYILRKINQQISLHPHPIWQNIRATGEHFLLATAKYQDSLQQEWIAQQAPVFMLQEINQMGITLQSFTNCLDKSEASKLWGYWQKMSGNRNVQEAIENIKDVKYQHADAASTLEKALSFLEILAGMSREVSRKTVIGEGLVDVQIEAKQDSFIQRFVNWMKEGDALVKVVVVVAILVLLIVALSILLNL